MQTTRIQTTMWTAIKWLFRGLKKGDWLWLLLAVAMASMTVTFVSLLSETVEQSMHRQAATALGADGVLRSSRPIEAEWQQLAKTLDLYSAESVSLVTMVQATSSQDFQLVKLKAVSPNYPLRGDNRLVAQNVKSSLAPSLTEHQISIEPKLSHLMPQAQQLQVGQLTLLIAGVHQPNALQGLNAFAPEVMMRLQDLSATQLVGEGSRATYELSVAGDHRQVQAWLTEVRQQHNPAWNILSAEAPSDDLQKTMETATLFLQLAALSAVIVAGLSILIASRFYLKAWQNSIALMRAFGASQSQIRQLFAWQLSGLAGLGSALGVGLGWLIFLVIQPWLADHFQSLVQVPSWPALLLGGLTGGLVLWGFAWPAYRKVVNIVPMQVLKVVPKTGKLRDSWFGLVFLGLLVWSLIGLEKLPWVLAGLLIVGGCFYLAAFALWQAIRFWQPHSSGWLRITLSSLQRAPDLLQIQLISFGLVLFVLILMTFVRQDLLSQWQTSLAPNTPNTFLMNIQPDQKEQTESILNALDLNPTVVAMARGRLQAKNGERLLPEDQESNRARRLLEREANIALLPTIPTHNLLLFSSEGRRIEQGVSIEQGMAELFDIKLGDVLTFDFIGKPVELPVTSIREVVWQSFELNFFFILPLDYAKQLPISYIGNFYLENSQDYTVIAQALNEAVPGVLLIDVSAIMQQVQQIMAQASWAVTGLYGFTLLSSILVLLTATLASQQGRVQGWLLLRTLGASQATLVKMGLMEFALLGGLAGLLAASFAQLASGMVSVFFFKMGWQWHPELWALSLLLGAGSLLILGWITQKRFLTMSPMELQRYLN